MLIATYQHNAAVATEVEEARAAASHSAEVLNGEDEEGIDQEQVFAEIDAQAAEARGSYTPAGIMLVIGAGSLLAGFRLYHRSRSADDQQ